MARLAYDCNSELRLSNFTNQLEIIKPFACTTDKYCLYCCNSQYCLLIYRRPPKHFWETWYFWLAVALLILFIITTISSYVISNCHNSQIIINNDSRSLRSLSNNVQPDEFPHNSNEISIHVIPTTGIMFPMNNNKMLLCPPQVSASYITPIVA